MLTDRYAQVRRVAAAALGEIGPEAGSAVEALSRCVKDTDEVVRRHAVVALGEVASDASVAVPALIQALHDASGLVRRCAAAAIRELGPAAPAAVPALIVALGEDDVKNRVVAAAALVRVGLVALPRLMEALHHTDAGVRRHVVTILGKLGGRNALALVRRRLDDPDADVRETATEVLHKMNDAVYALVRRTASRSNSHSPFQLRQSARTVSHRNALPPFRFPSRGLTLPMGQRQ